MTLLASLVLTASLLILHEQFPCHYSATYWDLGDEIALADEAASCDVLSSDFTIMDGGWIAIWTPRFTAIFRLPKDAGSGWFEYTAGDEWVRLSDGRRVLVYIFLNGEIKYAPHHSQEGQAPILVYRAYRSPEPQ